MVCKSVIIIVRVWLLDGMIETACFYRRVMRSMLYKFHIRRSGVHGMNVSKITYALRRNSFSFPWLDGE